jgi:hypothetical protein
MIWKALFLLASCFNFLNKEISRGLEFFVFVIVVLCVSCLLINIYFNLLQVSAKSQEV